MQNIFAGEVNAWALLPIVVIYVAIVAGVVFIDCGERRIPVQYAKRVVGRKMARRTEHQHSYEGAQRRCYADYLCSYTATIPGYDR